jgi:hypothetical protein
MNLAETVCQPAKDSLIGCLHSPAAHAPGSPTTVKKVSPDGEHTFSFSELRHECRRQLEVGSQLCLEQDFTAHQRKGLSAFNQQALSFLLPLLPQGLTPYKLQSFRISFLEKESSFGSG